MNPIGYYSAEEERRMALDALAQSSSPGKIARLELEIERLRGKLHTERAHRQADGATARRRYAELAHDCEDLARMLEDALAELPVTSALHQRYASWRAVR